MPIQKLIAKNANEGLKRIREQIGEDALILKTVKRNGKVEFFVEVEEEADAGYAHNDATQEPGRKDELDNGLKDEYQEARLKMLTAIAEKADIATEPEPASHRPNSLRPVLGNELTVKSLLEALRLEPSVAAQLRGYKRIDEVITQLGRMVKIAPRSMPGICAFVGPAGAGKTSSLTKLMVKHVMQFGEDACAIINCDRFRVGAREQANRLGELMGVEVQHVDASLTLNQAIANVHKRSFVAIDLPGLSIKDEKLTVELFKLSSSHYEIQRYLVMPANLGYQSLRQYGEVYGAQQGTQCILTHLDEAACLGDVLSFLVRSELALAYCSDGSHIPEDIIPAEADDLTTRALNLVGGQFAKAATSDLTKREGLSEMVMDL